MLMLRLPGVLLTLIVSVFSDADFHAEVVTLCVQAVRVLLEFPFFFMFEALIFCDPVFHFFSFIV